MTLSTFSPGPMTSTRWEARTRAASPVVEASRLPEPEGAEACEGWEAVAEAGGSARASPAATQAASTAAMEMIRLIRPSPR